MRTFTLTTFAALMSGAFSFSVPDGQAEGVYTVTYHEDGTEEHIRIGDAIDPNKPKPYITARTARTSILNRREWVTPTCYSDENTGIPLDAPTTDAAVQALDAQCGRELEVDWNKDIYSISGCVVAYFCNFINKATQCRAADRQYTSQLITNQCGSYFPGSTLQQRYICSAYDLTEYDSYGYENYCTDRGVNFCGRGVNGKREIDE